MVVEGVSWDLSVWNLIYVKLPVLCMCKSEYEWFSLCMCQPVCDRLDLSFERLQPPCDPEKNISRYKKLGK